MLKAAYPSQDAAFAGIKRDLQAFYRPGNPEAAGAKAAAVDRAVEMLQRLYGRNVFPAMKVSWGATPTTSGTWISRAASGATTMSHKAKDGSTISQDCELCHKQEELPTPEAQALN